MAANEAIIATLMAYVITKDVNTLHGISKSMIGPISISDPTHGEWFGYQIERVA